MVKEFPAKAGEDVAMNSVKLNKDAWGIATRAP